MPPRRRGRARNWTHHKGKTPRVPNSGLAPTEDEWELLDRIGTFILLDKNGVKNEFSLNDIAAVFPSDAKQLQPIDPPPENEWIAKIKSIRLKRDGETWVQVHWYFSPEDLREYLSSESFDASHCAKNERIYSHHSELIPCFQFKCLIPMVQFLEDDPDQSPILAHQFFCRYFFDTKSEEFSVHRYICNEKGLDNYSSTSHVLESSCICQDLYNPKDPDPAYEMHWCPRPSCRRAYHDACLRENEHYTPLSDTHDAVIRLRLASSADTDHAITLPDDDHSPLHIPIELLQLASQPMVRGGVHGIAGNVAVVVRARRVVHLALQEQRNDAQSDSDSKFSPCRIFDEEHELDFDLDDWDEDRGFQGWENAIVEDLSFAQIENDPGGVEAFVCPVCSGAI